MHLKVVTSNVKFFTLQYFDCLYSFSQADNSNNNYKSKFDITYIEDITKLTFDEPDCKYILFFNNLDSKFYLKFANKFDLIIVDNTDNPTTVLNDSCLDILTNYKNSVLLCNSSLHQGHKFYNKSICTNGDYLHNMKYYFNPFYPQYFEYRQVNYRNKKLDVVYIGGSNRTYRQFFVDKIKNDISMIDNIFFKDLVETVGYYHVFSIEDENFFNFLRSQYNVAMPHEAVVNLKNVYYENSIPIGMQKKFGLIPPGYFVLQEYLDYHCIAYPETSWTNNEITMTEKTIKCFMYEVIPFPVAGANAHKILNELGFRTAVDLLPEELKFDHILDHAERYTATAQALIWLKENNHVFKTDKAKEIVLNNKNNFIHGSYVYKEVEKLSNFIEKFCT